MIYDPLRHIDENLMLSGEKWRKESAGGEYVPETPEQAKERMDGYCAFLRECADRWDKKVALWKAKQEAVKQ